MEMFLFIIRMFLVAVFGVAAVGKLLDLEGSKKAAAGFGLPASLAALVGYALPFIELAIALLFISVLTSWYASLAAFALFVVFIAGMGWQLAKGNAPDCHCFGVVHSEPVGASSIVRNLIFATLAGVLGLSGKDVQGLSFAGMDSATVLLFGASVAAIAALLVMTFKLKVRVAVLEQASGISAEVEREGIGHPEDALPIGAPAPDFELPDAAGRMTSFEMLMMRGKPLLLLFVGPNCAPCKALLPEIEAWRAEFSGRLEIVLISSGSPEENIAKFIGVGGENILLQKTREVSGKFRATWTPSAVFVSQGQIASRVAVGDTQIRDLVDGLRNRDLSSGFVFVPRGANARVRIGEKVAEFAINDIDGREISNSYFDGRDTLVIFWSTTCSHCVAMMPDVKEWERSRTENDPQLLVFCEGDEAMYRELGLHSPLVIDPDDSTAAKLGKWGAPAGIVIDASGCIATETAIGAPAIWSLIGKQ